MPFLVYPLPRGQTWQWVHTLGPSAQESAHGGDSGPLATNYRSLIDDPGADDHRTHWMSRNDPPVVTAEPDREHLVLDLVIPLQVDGVDATATGELRWLPDVAWWPPSERAVLVTAALVTLGAVTALCTRAWKGQPGGFGALATAAVMVMLLDGGEAGSDLSAPRLDTSFPDWIRRWTIAASYSVVAPAMLTVAIGAWWHARTLRDTTPVEHPITAPST